MQEYKGEEIRLIHCRRQNDYGLNGFLLSAKTQSECLAASEARSYCTSKCCSVEINNDSQRTRVETQTHLGRDTNASGTRHERIWDEAHLCLLPRSPTSRKQQDGSSMGERNYTNCMDSKFIPHASSYCVDFTQNIWL